MKGIIANSFPKSGTHLLTRILELSAYKQSDTHLSRSLILYGPRNFIRNWKIAKRIEKKPDRGLKIDIEASDRRIKEKWFLAEISSHLKGQTFVQAHLPYSSRLEEALRKYEIKTLYIHRNPKDVLVSLKNYILKQKNHPNHEMLTSLGSDEQRFIALLIGFNEGSNVTMMAPFCEKYCRSILWKNSAYVCSVSFEKIIGQKGGGAFEKQREELARLFDYLRISKTEMDRVQTLVFNTKSNTFHKGIIGQWHEEFTPKVNEVFERHMEAAQLKCI